MDITQIGELLGLASTAVSTTGKAVSTFEAVKNLFSSGKPADNDEAQKLLNVLAVELTAANMMNVQLSDALRRLGQELRRQDEFETEKARYELFQTGQNDVVLRLKAAVANGQPAHFICPVCLNRDKLISYVTGEGDYKRCQTDNSHLFQFANTPLPDYRRKSRTDFDVFDT